MQPHLKKCFEGIDKLNFDDKHIVRGMYSVEGELDRRLLDSLDFLDDTGYPEQYSIEGEIDDF